jgi:hypothetical protein
MTTNNIDSIKMKQLISFFNNNIVKMKEIFLHHRLQEGHGVLSILLENDKDIKVAYLALDILNDEMKKDIVDRINKNNVNIIYFYLNTDDDARIVETDIRDIK